MSIKTLTKQKLPVLGTNGYPLQDAAVYGPIPSRRYGYSLGINPLPVTYKFCDFDCVYCQYGWTPRTGNGVKKTNEKLKSLAELVSEIETSFQRTKADETPVHVITIAGNGEPTLYPDFFEFVTALLKLRDHYYPKVPVGILSDSSQCHRPEIKKALQMLDERCMKLDGGDPKTIGQINKPAGGFHLERTIDGLSRLGDITIQSLFVWGSLDNTQPEQIEHWAKAIRRIKPKAVQVYTIDRPTADSGIKAVPMSRLSDIAAFCQRESGILTEVFD
ncbi:MAG: radical SAM protein [Candidatus Omnitrophica bacterium]|nr:radical SAM protein [Candidatus Omnitrophota bacterium]